MDSCDRSQGRDQVDVPDLQLVAVLRADVVHLQRHAVADLSLDAGPGAIGCAVAATVTIMLATSAPTSLDAPHHGRAATGRRAPRVDIGPFQNRYRTNRDRLTRSGSKQGKAAPQHEQGVGQWSSMTLGCPSRRTSANPAAITADQTGSQARQATRWPSASPTPWSSRTAGASSGRPHPGSCRHRGP